MDKKERIEQLVGLLNDYAYHYYTLDDPLIEDSQYDVLYDELVNLERETGYILENSPTKRVGGEVLENFEKHTHIRALYSLNKAQSKEELEAWMEKLIAFVADYNKGHQEKLPDPVFSVEFKFDGLTINLTYREGYLDLATTRGNGTVGEIITGQIKTIKSIPLKIKDKRLMEVQGEGLMPLSSLAAYNEGHEVKLKNARNAAAGALRNLDPKVTAERKLDAYFYNVNYLEDSELSSQGQMMDFIKENHFKIYPYEKKVKDFAGLWDCVEEIGKLRREIDILTDGVVVKLDDFKTRDLLGYTNKFPRWAIAYKFEPEVFTTIIKDVEWNVGRSGKVTPTALLEPVDIGDVTVKRATLNNIDDINRKKARVGSEVFVRRSNDVIPEILGVVDENQEDTREIEVPKECPFCGSELIRDGVHIFCMNSMSCEPQLIKRMVHFASRNAMNIEGLSEKTIEALLINMDIKSIDQLYSLTKEDLLSLDGFKEKKSQNLIDALERSKKVALSNFINSLGIPEVGEKTSYELAQKFKYFENLRQASLEELLEIDDIGEVVAANIVEFFKDEKISESIDRLLAKGIEIEKPKKEDDKFAGKTFVLTGSLENYSRKELTDLLTSMGAKVTSSVSKNTDYIVYGEKPGSKLDKGKELGIKLLSEKDLDDLLS
ncbi:MAG: NAD-dependent DNA ligase LigA [Finegoldia sp.]|nr:NAD-dependent DNA ligase LigA [Finegoldia sp.]